MTVSRNRSPDPSYRSFTGYPLAKWGKVFIDGSSRVIGRKQVSGYGIIGRELQEEEKLSCTSSAETTELYALIKACKVYQGKVVNIYRLKVCM